MSSTKSDSDSGSTGGDEFEFESARTEDGRGIDQLSSTFRIEIEDDVDTDADS